ncbi:MAG: O-antigen ligase family protein [Acidimicrobiales bacterium]
MAQAALGMVQAARGAAFGIEYLDFAGPLYPFGTSHAGRGGLTHPYHLAVVLVVAQGAALLGLRQAHAERRSPLPWLGALAVLSAGIGVTYTRAGAIGQVALVVCLLLGRADRRALAPAALAVVLGLGIGGAAFGDGWIARGTTTVGADENTSADSTRGERWREARELVEANPLLGVGPGRYVEALAETERIEYLPAHDLVAQEAAELGILGGVAAFALLGLLGLRVLRGGAWTGAVVLPLVPFLLLDAYPYVFATGLAASAIWLGLARASLDPAEPEPEAVA